MKARTRHILIVAAIFFAGVVTGGLPSVSLGERRGELRLRVDNLRDSLQEILRAELQLTEEQSARIAPLVSQACEDYRRITLDTVHRVGELVQATNERIARELTPPQAERLRALETERQALVRRKLDEDYLKKDFLPE